MHSWFTCLFVAGFRRDQTVHRKRNNQNPEGLHEAEAYNSRLDSVAFT